MAVKIGLKKAYYARIIDDIPGSITYDNPVPLLAIQQVQVNPRVSRVQVPGDDIVQEELSQCLGADVTAQRKGFTVGEESELLGRISDSGGGVYGGETDNAPYVAFGYMRTFNDGSGLYVWLLKMRFAPSNSTADTKGTDTLTPQYDTLSGSSITRTADGQWIYSRMSNDPNFGDTFFTKDTLEALASQVTHAPVALSSIVPADGAASVSKTAAIVLTFNNKIAREAVTLISSTGDIVETTKTFDAAGKVLTVTPKTALAATTKHIVSVAGIVDVYGQTLVATAKDFTTVA